VNRNFARRANLPHPDGQALAPAVYSEWFNRFRIMEHSIGSLCLRGIVS
jgi:hypothetical protein